MKKITKRLRNALYLVLVAVLLNSCGNEQPILNSETPFVVHKIKAYNDTHASYYNKVNAKSGTQNNYFGSWRARIVLPKGYYTVGDTIIFADPKHCN